MRSLAPLAALCLLSACNLLGGDDDDDTPPIEDPALAPEPVAPVDPPANDSTGDDTRQGGGSTLRIPGLEGLEIPLPNPNPNRPDPEPPARGTLAAAPPGSYDAGGHLTRAFMESRAETVHQALVAALDAHERSQVTDVPFEVVITDEPNAAAGCTRGDRRPVMMITSSMLNLVAGISETSAYDELASTETYEAYVTHVVGEVRGGRPVPDVEASAHSAPHATDAHKLARQVHLFDQQVAFILGHELAHHYRGHTNCVQGRSDSEVQRDELMGMLSRTVPPFEQPREVEADMWGLVDVLEAGHERPGGEWTEEGALLNMDFFRRLSDRGGQEILLAFFSTHPPSAVRIPIVRSTAQQWTPGYRPPRMPTADGNNTGGLPIPENLPIPEGLPIPRGLPIPGFGGGGGNSGN